MFADLLIRHGAPTLAGLKTANLFPCRLIPRAALLRELRDTNQVLVPRGLRLLPLRLEEDRALLYLFRPDRLRRDLSAHTAQRLLDQAGYPNCQILPCLRELRRRLESGTGFPHEIGLFLGYPPEDVQGFICHQGRGCKLTGCWKVYGDEQAARQCFAAYRSCTESYCRRRARGEGLAGLAVES